jgi:EpsI family protein
MVNARSLSLCALFLFGFASLGWLEWRSASSAPKPIGQLSELIPMKFGNWVGENVEIADETVQVLRAHSFINRLYTQARGPSVSLHVANWKNENTISPAPHHPEVCYQGAGWKILKRSIAYGTFEDEKFPIELILFERAGQRVVTGHWFETGDFRYTSDKEFQKERRRFWGTRQWPGTQKYLLQTTGSSIEAAQEILIGFAQELLGSMKSQELTS